MDTKKMIVLLVDDEPDIIKWIKKDLESQGYTVFTALSGQNALDILRIQPIDVLLVDIKMPGMDGIELIKKAKESLPELQCIVFTGHGALGTARETIKLSVIDYLLKPVDKEELFAALHKAKEAKENQKLARLAIEELSNTDLIAPDNETVKVKIGRSIIGQSKAIKNVFESISKVASSDTNVLITGESGTGKELVARAIHENSPRSIFPFIVVNCAAIPAELIESELFGHVKGAYTGAIQDKKGKFEEAQKGTIFLDEIGDMPMGAQAKILRVLQEKTVTRVGDNKQIAVDVHIIAATNKDLKQAVISKEFREDLYYRLNVYPIRLPPLRERKEDIALLINYFIENLNPSLMKKAHVITKKALERLMSYTWPGNIRELRNVIESAIVKADGRILSERHFDLSAGIEKQIGRRNTEESPIKKDEGNLTKKTLSSSDIADSEEKHTSELIAFVRKVIVGKIHWDDREGYLFDEHEKLTILAKELKGDGTKMAKVLNINKNNLNQILRRSGIRLRDIKSKHREKRRIGRCHS